MQKKHLSNVFSSKLSPLMPKKASGLRFYKSGYNIKGALDKCPEFIEEQIDGRYPCVL